MDLVPLVEIPDSDVYIDLPIGRAEPVSYPDICRIWYYNKPAYAACLCGQFSNTECFSPGFARETEGMLERMTMNKVLANTVCGMAPELCPPGNVLCQIQQAYCTGMINSRGTPGLDYAF